VAIAVNEDGYREILGAAESMKEDNASWVVFFQWLRRRGLDSGIVENHIFLDIMTSYNMGGEDITATFDTSSGGL